MYLMSLSFLPWYLTSAFDI